MESRYEEDPTVREASGASCTYRSSIVETGPQGDNRSVSPPNSKQTPKLSKKKRSQKSKDLTSVNLSKVDTENPLMTSILQQGALFAQQAQAAGYMHLATTISQAVLAELGSCESSPEIVPIQKTPLSSSPPKPLRGVFDTQRKSIQDILLPRKVSAKTPTVVHTPTSQMGISPRRMLIDVLAEKNKSNFSKLVTIEMKRMPQAPISLYNSEVQEPQMSNIGLGTAQFLDPPSARISIAGRQSVPNPFKESADFARVADIPTWPQPPQQLIGIADGTEDQSFILCRRESELPGEFELDSFLQSTRYIFEGGSSGTKKARGAGQKQNVDIETFNPLQEGPLDPESLGNIAVSNQKAEISIQRLGLQRLVSAEQWMDGPDTEKELKEIGIEKTTKSPEMKSAPLPQIPDVSSPKSEVGFIDAGRSSQVSAEPGSHKSTPKGPTLVPVIVEDKSDTPRSASKNKRTQDHQKSNIPERDDSLENIHRRGVSNLQAMTNQNTPMELKRLTRSDKLKDLKDFVKEFQNYKSSRFMKVREFTLPNPSLQDESGSRNKSTDRAGVSLRQSLKDEHNLYLTGRGASAERKPAPFSVVHNAGKFPGESFQTVNFRQSQESSTLKGPQQGNLLSHRVTRIQEDQFQENPQHLETQESVASRTSRSRGYEYKLGQSSRSDVIPGALNKLAEISRLQGYSTNPSRIQQNLKTLEGGARNKTRNEFHERASVKETPNSGFYSQRNRIKLPTFEDLSSARPRKISIEQVPGALTGRGTLTQEFSQDSARGQVQIHISKRLQGGRGSLGMTQIQRLPAYLTASVCSTEQDPLISHRVSLKQSALLRNPQQEPSRTTNPEGSTKVGSRREHFPSFAMEELPGEETSAALLLQKSNPITKMRTGLPAKVTGGTTGGLNRTTKLGKEFTSSGFLGFRTREETGGNKTTRFISGKLPANPTTIHTPSGITLRKELQIPAAKTKPLATVSPLLLKNATKRLTASNPVGTSANLSGVQKQLKIEIPSARGFKLLQVQDLEAVRPGKKAPLPTELSRGAMHTQPQVEVSTRITGKPTFLQRESALGPHASLTSRQVEPKSTGITKPKTDRLGSKMFSSFKA